MRKIYDHLTRSVTNSQALTDKSPLVPSSTGDEVSDAAESYKGDTLDFRFTSCDETTFQGGKKLAKHRRDSESTFIGGFSITFLGESKCSYLLEMMTVLHGET